MFLIDLVVHREMQFAVVRMGTFLIGQNGPSVELRRTTCTSWNLLPLIGAVEIEVSVGAQRP